MSNNSLTVLFCAILCSVCSSWKLIDSSEWISGSSSNHLPFDLYLEPKPVGSGTNGEVFQAIEVSTGETVAIKVIDKSFDIIRWVNGLVAPGIEDEIWFHMSLDHPNIVKFKKVYENDRYVFLVMENCSGGNLADVMERGGTHWTEDRARLLLSQMASALVHMKEHSVVHRDIKFGNILLCGEDNWKITDFGSAAQLAGDSDRLVWLSVGTAGFMAPEVEYFWKTHSFPADVYSLGVVMTLVLTVVDPHADYFMVDPNVWRSLSANARSIISRMRDPDQYKRIDAEEIARHAWLMDLGTGNSN